MTDTYKFSNLVEKAVTDASQNFSSARKEAFAEGGMFALQMISEMGLENAIGINTRQLIREIRGAVETAKQTLNRFDDINLATEALDERAASILALTQLLLDRFLSSAKKKDDFSGRTVLDGKEVAVAFRSVSYIVWAYASTAPYPEKTEEDAKA